MRLSPSLVSRRPATSSSIRTFTTARQPMARKTCVVTDSMSQRDLFVDALGAGAGAGTWTMTGVGAATGTVVSGTGATGAEVTGDVVVDSTTRPTTGAEGGASEKRSAGRGTSCPSAMSTMIVVSRGTSEVDGSAPVAAESTAVSVTASPSPTSSAELLAADPMAAVIARTDVSDAPVTMTLAATAGLVRDARSVIVVPAVVIVIVIVIVVVIVVIVVIVIVIVVVIVIVIARRE